MSELGKRLSDGDNGAFSEVVGQYSRRVYALCYRILRDEEEARDITQEVFVKVYTKRRSFGGKSEIYTWIYRIAVNASLTYLKKKGREKGRAAFDENAAVVGPVAGAPSSPEGSSALSELKGRVDEAVGSLPAHFRASFALVAGEGLSHRDAARVLGCSENTVAWRMHKARKLLRARLRPFLEEVGS